MKGLPDRLEREVTVVENGNTYKAILFIGDIRLIKKGRWKGQWQCSYLIPGILAEVASFRGRDPMQVLSRTMLFVRNLIRGSIEDGTIDMWWRNKGDWGGFR